VVVAANAAVLAVTKIKKALVLKKAPAANNRSLDEKKGHGFHGLFIGLHGIVDDREYFRSLKKYL
jgi:hypothetical protein